MDKKEAMNEKPSLKKELALGMKKGEPPTKRLKEDEDEEEEERHGRREEYDVFKTDPVKLERLARARRKKQRLEALWRKHLHNT